MISLQVFVAFANDRLSTNFTRLHTGCDTFPIWPSNLPQISRESLDQRLDLLLRLLFKRRTERLFQTFSIDRCLECFYKDYDMFRLAGSICWLTSSDVTGDTSKKARGRGQPAEVIFCSFYCPHAALLPVTQLRLLFTVLSLSWWLKRAAVSKCLAGRNRSTISCASSSRGGNAFDTRSNTTKQSSMSLVVR